MIAELLDVSLQGNELKGQSECVKASAISQDLGLTTIWESPNNVETFYMEQLFLQTRNYI